MKILAIDTATDSCSVAVMENDRLLCEINLVSGRTHSTHLMPLIRQVASMAGIELSEVDGFAVSKGPGSFTGLRIGLSTVKGLAVGFNRPLVGISTLHALAVQAAVPDYMICSLVDARKKEVYCATYRRRNQEVAQLGPEVVQTPQRVADSITEPCVFVGNGAQLYAETLVNNGFPRRMLAPRSQHLIRASTIARLSLPHFKSDRTHDAALLVPSYVRKSDAELNFKPGRAPSSHAIGANRDSDHPSR